MDRRNFIRSSCTLCVGAIGIGFIASELAGCAAMPIYKATAEQDMIKIPLSSFKESKILVVRNNQLEFDILLVKKSETDVNALLMKCTHQDNPLTATNSGMFCSAHGSSFDLQGNVTREPALKALKKFKTEINNQVITIYIKS